MSTVEIRGIGYSLDASERPYGGLSEASLLLAMRVAREVMTCTYGDDEPAGESLWWSYTAAGEALSSLEEELMVRGLS